MVSKIGIYRYIFALFTVIPTVLLLTLFYIYDRMSGKNAKNNNKKEKVVVVRKFDENRNLFIDESLI